MVNLNPSIFKAYDIRGIYPSDLNEEGMDRVIRSIYTFFKKNLQKEKITVLLSRDMRVSSPSLTEIAKKALIEMGADIIDAGLLSTPSFYFAVFHYGYDTGIQITASHNPKEYAGTKFLIRDTNGIRKIGKATGMDEIKNMALSDMTFENSAISGTITVKTNVLEDEYNFWMKELGNPQIKNFNIVADPANAMGGLYVDKVASALNQNLVKMNFELDGTFPVHQPDPLQAENLVDLQKRILEEKADLGLAPDGDGDRLFFIDEKGEVVPASIISSIVARELLKKYPGETIVIDIRYLLTPEKIVEECGGKFADVRVGHAFITKKLQETGGIFAGESSAHYYFRQTGGGEAQIPVIMIVLKVMTEENKKLSELVDELHRSYESGEYNFRVTNAQEIMDYIKEKYKDGVLTTIDCIEIAYPDWRFSIRTSNTEPLLRLNVEAYDKNVMESKRDELISEITKVADIEQSQEH